MVPLQKIFSTDTIEIKEVPLQKIFSTDTIEIKENQS
jgi:hypothetical protein